jgi:hypothetical protein
MSELSREELLTMLQEKSYLGDAVYVRHDGYQIWLTTSNGYMDTNSIALEPSVFRALGLYAERVKGIIAAIKDIDKQAKS